MTDSPLRPGRLLTGPLFNEPMRVETVRPGGDGVWVVGLVGQHSERFRNATLGVLLIDDGVRSLIRRRNLDA